MSVQFSPCVSIAQPVCQYSSGRVSVQFGPCVSIAQAVCQYSSGRVSVSETNIRSSEAVVNAMSSQLMAHYNGDIREAALPTPQHETSHRPGHMRQLVT